ncbi:hypothetical protein [Microbacterium algeriense]|uniref:Major capsid protein n=1 Tax=Microbacterium algeriense TaxID=2615184 RepID=A0ABQ6V622_9MICO|nr:hypothetical protein [Microbacterium algeriense]KAB1864566.1 hypothetical protein F6A08_10735 [Microbacterium algeriense]
MDVPIRDIYGADRGFNVAADIVTQTADGVPLNDIYNEFIDALNEWNLGRSALSAMFTSNTIDSFAQLPKEPGKGEDFEPQSEFGVPRSSRRDVDYFRMGLPLEWFDAASRFTAAFLRDASREQVDLQFQDKLEMDNRLVFRKTMSALTDKRVAGSRDVNENGVDIFDLWDGSTGEVPPSYDGKTFTDTHSHYLVSGAATVDGGDIKALTDTIQEHGYGRRESGEQVVIFAHPTEADAIATFRRDPANLAANPYDFIPSVSAPAYLTDLTIVGDKPPAQFNGLPIEGSYGDAWISKNYRVPQGYVIALATSGPNSSRNPLLFREHISAQHRGLRLVNPNDGSRYPLVNSYFTRGFGVGVRHRGAAAVMQIKASGSYQNPIWP